MKLGQSHGDWGTEAEGQAQCIRGLFPESEGETETELSSREPKIKSPHVLSE